MNALLVRLTAALLCVAAGCTSAEPARRPRAPRRPLTLTFDERPTGRVPIGWRIDGTRQGAGPVAEWAVTTDPSAPSPPNVLALTAARHRPDQAFNLCWTDTVQFGDGRLSVKFMARSGVVDQGGGPIWRVRDASNYYICRANPLERNFRLYKVVDGTRQQLASASVDVTSGVWHTITVEHVADVIICTLDGRTRIDATDDTLPGAGGVGLWTKGDALTSFDDLIVSPIGE